MVHLHSTVSTAQLCPRRAGAKFIRDGLVQQPDGTYENEGDFDGGDAMTVLFSVLLGSYSLG